MGDRAQSGERPEEAAALVIRVWRETDGGDLKARITKRPDLGAEAEATSVVTSPEDVYDEVRAWLEEFVGRTGGQTSAG
jgi:hypothetical protein